MITSEIIARRLGDEILDKGQVWNHATVEQQYTREIIESYLSWAIDIGLLTSPRQLTAVIQKTIRQGWC